jgi:hypothetical protein
MPGMTLNRVRVLVSSRNSQYETEAGETFDLRTLRQALKSEIEAARLFDEQIFDCWVNETEPTKAAARDLWDECLAEVRRAHVVLVLYNGDAGWTSRDKGIGICQAELQAALHAGRARTRVIQLPLARVTAKRHDGFRRLVEREQLFTATPATSVEEAIRVARGALVEVVTVQSRVGGSVLRKDAFALGQALAWAKLDFATRSAAMRAACASALRDLASSKVERLPDDLSVPVTIGTERVLFCIHAIPAATSVAAARELVGKPHLYDHARYREEGTAIGPVHLIACYKSATEKQATDLLGFPDATVLPTTFGVFLADEVQKIQVVFLANCRDETSVAFAVQRFMDWLVRAGEDGALLVRARARRRIVKAIHDEQEGKPRLSRA